MMINLIPAKCPCCGGSIELDDKMKKAECKFCKNTIIVDEAIQKYKIDISGKIEIDGYKSDRQRFEDAEKYFKLGKYEETLQLYEEILLNDNFNVQAQCGWIKSIIKYYDFKVNYIENENEPRQKNKYVWQYIGEIYERHNILQKLDEEKLYNNYLKDYNDIIEYLKVEYKKLLEDEKKCEELSQKVMDTFEYPYTRLRLKGFDGIFLFSSEDQEISDTQYYNVEHRGELNHYRWKKICFLRDGTLNIEYENVEQFPTQPAIITLNFETPKASNIRELELIVNEYLTLCPKNKFKLYKIKHIIKKKQKIIKKLKKKKEQKVKE